MRGILASYLVVLISSLWLLVISILCTLHLFLLWLFSDSSSSRSRSGTYDSILNLEYPLPFLIDSNAIADKAIISRNSTDPLAMDSGYETRLKIVLWAFCITISLAIHELGHIYYANKHGIRIEGLGFKLFFWSGSMAMAVKVNGEDMKQASSVAATAVHGGGLLFNLWQILAVSLSSWIFQAWQWDFYAAVCHMMLVVASAILLSNALPIFGLDGFALTRLLVGADTASLFSRLFLALAVFSFIIYPSSFFFLAQ